MTISFSDFFEHVMKGRLPQVEQALSEHPEWARNEAREPGRANNSGPSALYLAARMGRADVLAALLRHCDDAAWRDGTPLHGTPLMGAADGGHLDCVNLLLARGSDPSFVPPGSATGFSAFMKAAYGGHLDCVKALFSPAEALRATPDTALTLASRNGHAECVEFLIPHSDAKAVSRRGATALSLAAFSGNERCVAALLPVSDPLARADDHLTALAQAARNGHLAVIEMLLPHCEWGVEGQGAHFGGKTALAIATEEGHVEAVRALLRGAEKNGVGQEEIERAAAGACRIGFERSQGSRDMGRDRLDALFKCLELVADLLPAQEAASLLEKAPKERFKALRQQLPARLERDALAQVVRLSSPREASPGGEERLGAEGASLAAELARRPKRI